MVAEEKEMANLIDYKGKKMPESAFAKKVFEDWKLAKAPLAELHSLMEVIDRYYDAEYWDKTRAKWRLSPVTNFIYKMVTQTKAQINKSEIAPVVKGENSIDDDGSLKKLEDAIRYTADNSDLDEVKDDVIEAGLLHTTGFIKVTWDQNEMGGSAERGNAWVGKVKYSEVDPSNVYPDPKAYKIQDCRYFIVAVPKTLEYLRERWPDKADRIKPDSFGAEVKVYTRPNTDGNNDEALLLEYWWKYKGTVNCAYVVGDVVLDVIYDVYADGKYPFVKFTPKHKRKSMWGLSLPKQIKGNQESLNKLIEMVLTNAMRTANQQKLYDANRINGEKITNEPGLLIPVINNDGRPLSSAYEPVATPNMPPYVRELIEMFKNDIKDIGGIYEAATGDTPGQVTAATAIAMLAEQASIPIEDINKQLYKTFEEVYEMTASRIIQFVQEERMMMVTDPETGAEKPVYYRGTEFKDLDYKITIQATKATAMTKAYIAEQANQLFEKGLLTPEEYLESIDFPLKDKVIQRLKDQAQFPPELMEIVKMIPPEVLIELAQQYAQPPDGGFNNGPM